MVEHPRTTSCADFDERSAELALGIVEPAERDVLTAHAGECERCGSELESLAGVADRLSLLAPDAEPPVGFELRAVGAMTALTAPVPTSAAATRSRARRVGILAAAAVVVVLAGLVGALVAHSRTRTDDRLAAFDRVGVSTAHSGLLIDDHGANHGSVLLVDGDRAQLTMTLTGLDRGVYRCSFLQTDGSVIDVASWPIGDGGEGTWTVPLDGDLLEATRSGVDALTVVVTEADGTTVSTASLR